jgi:hypothetical protein
MDIIFEKKEDFEKLFDKPIKPFKSETPVSPEEQMLKIKDSFGVKVQSVALPNKFKLFGSKTESEVMDWLENKVHNVNTAFHKINSKYTGDTERTNWNNNKSQNKRFLETKRLFEKGLYYH